MTVQLAEEKRGKTITVHVTGKLSRADYQQFVPQVERAVAEHGKIRILVVMDDFAGWDMGALWEDIKFDAKHFSDVERIAMVGEKRWQEGMAHFCKPFTKAEIRYFERGQLPEAHLWLEENGERKAVPRSR
ncbi:MAG: STAS/SEC14 domain-containing protein [Phycisphaeraceae bacterium]